MFDGGRLLHPTEEVAKAGAGASNALFDGGRAQVQSSSNMFDGGRLLHPTEEVTKAGVGNAAAWQPTAAGNLFDGG